MSTTAAPPHLNGISVVPAEGLRETAFLERLLQIRDEVLASKHPRIHLAPKILEQVAPRTPQHTLSSRHPTNGTLNGTASSQLLPARPDTSLQHRPSTEFVALAPQTQRPFSAKSGSSGIDPVLLEKSDNLIRAELQLKRQQIERALKDELDKKSRTKDSGDDRETRLDVEGLLTRAHEVVKPVSGLQIPITNSDGTESFDDSYYSSKADSWSPEQADANQNGGADATESLMTQTQPFSAQALVTAPNSAIRRDAQPQRVEHDVIDLDEEPYEPADDIEIYEPEPARAHEDAEESDYSPPPADIGPSELNRTRTRERGQGSSGGLNGSRRQSPTGQPPPIQNPRKHRREERQERRREKANKRAERAVRSPEPYIKEEPQSPPPFSAYPESQPSKRRALQPLPNDVEVVSAREGSRIQPVYYREQESSSRPLRQYEEPSSPTVIRVPQRRMEREDQDLRRVASLQYARRPFSPSGAESYAAPEPRQSRASSHAFIERPMEQPVYRETSARPSAAPRYVRERSRSPIHEYLPRAQSPVVMAPPRRIVVDQYGNKYYAAPADVRESVAPSNRRIEVDPYFERAVTREPTMRAPTRPEIYEDDDIQRMPPPPPRRYVEAADAEVVEARPFRQREASHRPVEMEYRPQEAVERRPVVQYEEMGLPREYMPSRAYSVRPEVVRREAPEGYTRHESVQPGHVRVAAPRYREVSVVHPDPFDDRRYTFAAPQPRRYVDEGAERPVEAAQEPFGGETRRVTYRY